jgi:hypothetical protein
MLRLLAAISALLLSCRLEFLPLYCVLYSLCSKHPFRVLLRVLAMLFHDHLRIPLPIFPAVRNAPLSRPSNIIFRLNDANPWFALLDWQRSIGLKLLPSFGVLVTYALPQFFVVLSPASLAVRIVSAAFRLVFRETSESLTTILSPAPVLLPIVTAQTFSTTAFGSLR